jgi:chromosome segregation protein
VYLKSLSIKGFKSFADPATLELEPGVTVVVGPNGSGKSNVVDAIAWVLGAQAPTAVRSAKMDDVIFAGTMSKPALGRAEVELTIDNSDGLLPIDFTEVTITRTLFRSGDSDYSINGVSCRLLDITELLSDSGVGRQQHIIVSQGQIDAVLNSRPEDRRAVIEEAAGVLKYRKRKERAERRLNATEENLNRLNDLVREVRRQLRPLEKQADAARRHGAVVAELSALRIHLVGRELSALTGKIEAGHRQHVDFDRREAELKSRLAGLDAAVLDAEAELAALGGSDVADVHSRALSLRERITGQGNVIGERQRRLEGELQSAVDEGVVSSLEAEAARIVADLQAIEHERTDLSPAMFEIDTLERQLATDREAFEETWGEGVGPSPVQAAEVRAQVQALQAAARRDQQETTRIVEQLEALGSRHDRLVSARAEAQATLDDLTPRSSTIGTELDRSASRLSEAEGALESAREDRRTADDDASRWSARADALRQALDAARSAAGADALASTEGVLGTLLELIDIDPGWEAAIEAAAGEALRAVVVDNAASGRRALESLAAQDLPGAVLALGRGTSFAVEPNSIRSRVRPLRPDVSPLLDALFGSVRAVEGGWTDALDAAMAAPDGLIVSSEGDRFGPAGWRIGQAGSGATGAALDEALAAAVEAEQVAAAAAERQRQAQSDLDEAKRSAGELERETRVIEQRMAEAAAIVERSANQLNDIAVDRERLDRQRGEIDSRVEADRAELEDLQLQLPGLEEVEAAHHDRTKTMAEARAALEDRMTAVSARRTELEVKAASVDSRRQVLLTRQGEVEARLTRLVEERSAARGRREHIQQSLEVVADLGHSLDHHRAELAGWIAELHREQEAQSEASREVSATLSTRRSERQSAERELIEVRERRGRVEVAEAEHRIRLETLTEALRGELDTEPDVAMAAGCPEVPDGVSPEGRVRELERELKLMGPINPLALEEFEELKQRHEFLDGQLSDVKNTRRDLQRLIHEIDDEIVSVFSNAYADVATNFVELFQVLFPGGRGAVVLTEPNDLLNTGVEIEAKPSGKNVKKLSLLSGGERSLVALGFLFAVFKSRPSPFYVMDEVEAALDDMNLKRLLSLIDEFRKEAQLVIVSHQKKTMEAADVLYGVTMKPGGSSKVVSERVSTS